MIRFFPLTKDSDKITKGDRLWMIWKSYPLQSQHYRHRRSRRYCWSFYWEGKAIKHHLQLDGQIKISASEQGSYNELIVANDDPAIPLEDDQEIVVSLPIFAPRDRKKTLAWLWRSAKKILEPEGGKITLSVISGIGSTFGFTEPKHLGG